IHDFAIRIEHAVNAGGGGQGADEGADDFVAAGRGRGVVGHSRGVGLLLGRYSRCSPPSSASIWPVMDGVLSNIMTPSAMASGPAWRCNGKAATERSNSAWLWRVCGSTGPGPMALTRM